MLSPQTIQMESKMNVLEAYKSLKEGNYIRFENKNDVIEFFFQTTLHPFGIKNIVRIDLDGVSCEKRCPENLEGLSYEEVETFCVSALESDLFQEITYDSMIKEIQKKWLENNED
jgi:hypothetical protein